mmetsp:Transcript_84607/g.141462  ORF Transcript_84607/g.141462 Transcript_84607/m.141462 type:complete len:88 (-) Transcript_84607:2151-2414(-)
MVSHSTQHKGMEKKVGMKHRSAQTIQEMGKEAIVDSDWVHVPTIHTFNNSPLVQKNLPCPLKHMSTNEALSNAPQIRWATTRCQEDI